MPNDTSRMKRDQLAQSAQEQLRQLTQDVNELYEMLKHERNALRPRAMGLPLGTLDSLLQVQQKLKTLGGTVMSRQIELRQLRALAETTSVINSSLDTDSVLNQVMDTVIQITGAERGYIMLMNKASGELEFRVARGIDREQLAREEFIVSKNIVQEVFNTGDPVLTFNAKNDPRYQGFASIVGYKLQSILAVPLIVRGETIGVVYCDNRDITELFKQHELDLLKAFANQAAVAIENARLFEEARTQLAEITEIRDLTDNIFTSIVSGLIILDGDDVITACNPAAEQITGMNEARVIGARLYDALPGFVGVCESQLMRVRQGGTLEAAEAEVPLGSEWRTWRIVMSPLRDVAGRSQGVVLVLDDLTEQRQREAQLTHVRRYLPLALVENIRSEDLAALGGQEREVSVLFADVRGFTSFSQDLQPEYLMEIINKYMSIGSDAINQQEGVVDKYMGDAVTGLFNTPLNPQEDHALRAVRAASLIAYEVQVQHEVMPENQRLLFGIGVHTGSAVLGNVGSQDRREFSVLGDAVEMSKLLQENAHGGEVIVSAATYEIIKDHFDFEALEPRKTKDYADFTIMYRLIGLKKKGTGPLPQ